MRKIKIVSILLIIVSIIGISLIYGMYFSIENLTIKSYAVSSEKIDKSLNNIQIAMISDIHYNNYMDHKRLNKMLNKVQKVSPDVILFGGDLFDTDSNKQISEETISELTSLLKELDAPLGKFAVLGEQDLKDENTKNTVIKVLSDADFEIITNKNVVIRNKNKSGINLIGIDSLDKGSPNIESALGTIDDKTFNIVLTHAPDILDMLPANTVDVVLAGHSHGGQVDFMFYKVLNDKQYAQKYVSGTHQVNNTKLFISNGFGTTKFDMRLFAPPQLLVLNLKAE